MKALDARNHLNTLMSRFVTEVEGATAMGHFDINRVAEDVLIPILSEVYELPALKNLNARQANFPGVDLGDTKARVAIQVTSTPTAAKIKDTLQTVVDRKLYLEFDRVIVYVLTRKQGSYTGNGYDEIVGSHFQFDKDKDIHDFTDVIRLMAQLPLDRQRVIEDLLAANFGDGSVTTLSKAAGKQTETLHLNLLEMSFPDKLYVADLAPKLKGKTRETEKQLVTYNESNSRRWGSNQPPKPRDRVSDFLKENGLRFSVDWEYHAGQIITFHNLEDSRLPLARAIESGTVTTMQPAEYYGLGDAEENVFRSLLRRCLQQKLYQRGVKWQNRANLFIFGPEQDEEVRKEKWVGKKSNAREVYQVVMKDPKKMKPREDGLPPNLVLHHKHLAFGVQQLRIGKQWFLVVRPDWFFSYDGYKESSFAADSVSWLKRREGNGQIFDQLRFIVYFLCHDKSSTLFEEVRPYRFLKFGKLASLDGAPALDDSKWLPGESKLKQQQLNDDNPEIPDLLAGDASATAENEDGED